MKIPHLENVTSRTRQPACGVRVYAGVQSRNPYPNPGKTRRFTPGFSVPVLFPNEGVESEAEEDEKERRPGGSTLRRKRSSETNESHAAKKKKMVHFKNLLLKKLLTNFQTDTVEEIVADLGWELSSNKLKVGILTFVTPFYLFNLIDTPGAKNNRGRSSYRDLHKLGCLCLPHRDNENHKTNECARRYKILQMFTGAFLGLR